MVPSFPDANWLIPGVSSMARTLASSAEICESCVVFFCSTAVILDCNASIAEVTPGAVGTLTELIVWVVPLL